MYVSPTHLCATYNTLCGTYSTTNCQLWDDMLSLQCQISILYKLPIVLLCLRREASEGIMFSGYPSVCPDVRPSVRPIMYFCTTPTWSHRLNS